MDGQGDSWARFAAIEYDNNQRQFVYYARRSSRTVSSYICQLQQQGLINDENNANFLVEF